MSAGEATSLPSRKARKVLVTGSTSGIGRAITEALLAAGDTVVGIGRDHTKFDPPSDRYLRVAMDLADLPDSAAALDTLAREHHELDTIVCCAGSGRFGELEQFSATQIRRGIDLNLTSHLLVARAFVPRLKRRGHGDIIFMGSASSHTGRRMGSIYCAAKFGLRGAAQALRQECARSGVRVTLINPGAVDSPFFDELAFAPEAGLANALLPADIADVVMNVLAAPSHVVFDEINLAAQHRSFRRT